MKRFVALLILSRLLIPAMAHANTTYSFTSTGNFSSTSDYISCVSPANCQNFTTSQNISGSFTLSTPLAASTTTNLINDPNLLAYSFSTGVDNYTESNSVKYYFLITTDANGYIQSGRIILEQWQGTVGVGNYWNYVDTLGITYHASVCGAVSTNIAGQTVCDNETLPNTSASVAIGASGAWPTSTPSAVPTLSEWTQLMLGLMVMALLGWHFHRERSN